jgi:hypothetical protein
MNLNLQNKTLLTCFTGIHVLQQCLHRLQSKIKLHSTKFHTAEGTDSASLVQVISEEWVSGMRELKQ